VGSDDGYIMISSDVVQKPGTTNYYITQSMNDGYFVNSKSFKNIENSIAWNSDFENIQSIPTGTSNRYVKFQSIVMSGRVHTIALTNDNRIHHLQADFGQPYDGLVNQLASNNAYFSDFTFDKFN